MGLKRRTTLSGKFMIRNVYDALQERRLTSLHLHHRSRKPSVKNTSPAPSNVFACTPLRPSVERMTCVAGLGGGAKHRGLEPAPLASCPVPVSAKSVEGESRWRFVLGPSSTEDDLARFTPVDTLNSDIESTSTCVSSSSGFPMTFQGCSDASRTTISAPLVPA